ncbi:osteoclast-associated immunoglobulin-like receptor [Chelonia mydas]|uniref:osteoclast-associated immunoglobulin-like receptor n=1 Tax=Chelonia mydas TaxID=8469 RepID=UPI001CA7C829|nr:osteoclast-associated immunoglobulin-like receptor [Chelonia mydas]
MASALTVLFLGCWLAGHSGAWGEPSYPKPNISLHPSGAIAPGGAVTVRCECRCRGARVLLYKAGDPEARQGKDPPEDVAQFFIHNMSQRDAGSYSCQYSIKSNLSVCSEPSDAMELVVAGEGPGSASPLPAPHPAGYSEGLSPNGPGSALSSGSSRGDTRLGSGDAITAGFPSQGEQKLLEIQGRGRGDPCPQRGCRTGGLSQGDVPPADTQRSQGPEDAQLAPAPVLNSLPTSLDN